MGRVFKFLRLDFKKRCLFLEAALLLLSIRVALRFLPFRLLLRAFSKGGSLQPVDKPVGPEASPPVSWAIETAGRFLPGRFSCLVRALAAQRLLARRGQVCLLRIGVAKDERGSFCSHAWVESRGRVVVGHYGERRWTPLCFQAQVLRASLIGTDGR